MGQFQFIGKPQLALAVGARPAGDGDLLANVAPGMATRTQHGEIAPVLRVAAEVGEIKHHVWPFAGLADIPRLRDQRQA